MAENALTKNLTVRLSQTDDIVLTQMALRLGTKRTRLLRKLLHESAGLGPYLLEGDLDVFREALRQVRAVGVNLNQLTHAVNAGKTHWSIPEDSETVRATLKAVQSLREELTSIIARSRNRPVRDAG